MTTPKHDTKYHKFIKKLVNANKKEALRGLLSELDEVEIADAMIQVKLKHQIAVLDVLDAERASEVLGLLHHSPILHDLTEHMKTEKLSNIIEEMPKDDAADFMSILGEERADAVLNKLSQKDRKTIIDLLQYNEESAGGIMNPYVVTVSKSQNVAEAVQTIRTFVADNDDLDQFYTIYVVDEYNHLIGTLEATQLLLAEPERKIKELMDPNVVAVDVDRDQEEVAAHLRVNTIWLSCL